MLQELETRRASLTTEPVELDCPPAALLDALRQMDDPVLLDSAALNESFGRYSVLTCCPLDVLSLADGRLTDRSGCVLADSPQTLWATLDRAFAAVRADPPPEADCPYAPGWFGYLGYELGRQIECLPGQAAREIDLPDLRLGFYDAVLVFDALTRTWSRVELQFDPPLPTAGRAAAALRRIVASAPAAEAEPYPAELETADATRRPLDDVRANFTPAAYRQAVRKCVDYIAAGDIFQVNLSQRFCAEDIPDPAEIYRALRRRSPAWYAAYLGFDTPRHRIAVLSSSPELFLRVRGNRVITRPIKGTRPRIGVDSHDRAAADELLASEKDNAELAMIIDLVRNDLGRVCEFGSVRVTDPRRLETHPTVFHLVGTVAGRLREGIGAAELIRATFPGGSITGAPKIRAMEIIDELEPPARGVYTGCVGTVSVTGQAEWNIAIRTILCADDRAYIQVGGGIVADSTPDGEYEETLAKARAMLEAVAEARQAVRA